MVHRYDDQAFLRDGPEMFIALGDFQRVRLMDAFIDDDVDMLVVAERPGRIDCEAWKGGRCRCVASAPRTICPALCRVVLYGTGLPREARNICRTGEDMWWWW